MKLSEFTGPQLRLLQKLAHGERHIYGPEVRVAQRLPQFVTLEDDGYMRVNNERWRARLTSDGVALFDYGKVAK